MALSRQVLRRWVKNIDCPKWISLNDNICTPMLHTIWIPPKASMSSASFPSFSALLFAIMTLPISSLNTARSPALACSSNIAPSKFSLHTPVESYVFPSPKFHHSPAKHPLYSLKNTNNTGPWEIRSPLTYVDTNKIYSLERFIKGLCLHWTQKNLRSNELHLWIIKEVRSEGYKIVM